mmetsp:Transcript_36444/g.85579  ORF Transcript_36444/g.85579 Transcript_36444/m.85579 type:complete len:426 (-) Transcript_36444:64-1341(-)
MGAIFACHCALAVHATAHAAGAFPGPGDAAHLVRGRPALFQGSSASGARARALLAAMDEGDVPSGYRRGAQVSDHGRFRSTRGVVSRGSLQANGHHTVKGGGETYLLDHLICAAFHGSPLTPEHVVIHKDADPSNNAPNNLHWATQAEIDQQWCTNNPSSCNPSAVKSKPVRGRKQGTTDEWTHFDSISAASRELGPGFHLSNLRAVLNGRRTHVGGWAFEYTPQYIEIEGEQWRTVVLDRVESGAYVSDHGRFRGPQGLVEDARSRDGGGAAPGVWQVMINTKGHYFHRLVCTAWHGPPPTPEHTQVKHKDLDPFNNTPANLEWATPAEIPNDPNRKSRGALSKPVRGRKQGTKDEWRQFMSCNAAARELGLRPSGVSAVANGRYSQTDSWTFEFRQQYENAEEVRKDVVLPSTSIQSDEVTPD